MTEQPVRTATFFEQVKAALLHYDDPQWLGTHSPLAAPYFLGVALHGAAPSPTERGLALLTVLEKTLESLWGGPLPTDGQAMLNTVVAETAAQGQGGRYHCLILELNYRRRCFKPAPKSQAAIYNDILHISRPTHDRHLAQAVDQLGALLLQRLRPTLRPEQPTVPAILIGREALLAQLLHALQSGQCVSLTGAGGMGKSSLGVAVTEQWPSPAVFWYTLRPTVNDQLDSLLFALGYFLHQHGASTLWQQLIADGGHLKQPHLALGLVRTDLAALAQPPLLCFDELDFLRPLTLDQLNPKHVQVLEFIDTLRTHAPLLLIGQRAFWESDGVYAIDGLTEPQLATLLTTWAIPATAEEVARLHAYTSGNPRLAELCSALYLSKPQEGFTAVLDDLPQAPALLALWHRLERRLPARERRLLQALAVFRTPAPVDAWGDNNVSDPEEAAALSQLISRRLVRPDDQGGIALLPALRQVIYDELPVETREHYHLQAGAIRAERGEYTAAAYHLAQAEQAEAAVALWYANRTTEINRGQARAALAIFEQISARRVGAKRQKELQLLRSELYQLFGEPAKVVETLSAVAWPPTEATSVDAALLLGKALDLQGQTDAARTAYAGGLTVAADLSSKMVYLHTQRSLSYLHERDMAQAWQEANRARYLAENMVGTLHEQSGQLDAAHTHYTAALELAQTINDQAGVARNYHNLGNLACRRLQIEEAICCYNLAMASHQQIGDRVGLEYARSGLVTTYMQALRYPEVIAPAQQALTFFQRLGDSFWTALNASNLAEACTELGNLSEAERYAALVLEQEEPHSHPYALFTLGRVREQQQRLSEAELYLSQARKVAELNQDRYLVAYVWEALGKIYQSSGQMEPARAAFTQAQQAFQTLQITEKAAALTRLLADLDA